MPYSPFEGGKWLTSFNGGNGPRPHRHSRASGNPGEDDAKTWVFAGFPLARE